MHIKQSEIDIFLLLLLLLLLYSGCLRASLYSCIGYIALAVFGQPAIRPFSQEQQLCNCSGVRNLCPVLHCLVVVLVS